MKIWAISDTHNGHEYLKVPPGIDMVIHAGDASVNPIPAINYHEMIRFIEWYSALPIEHKIFVPGNHDTSVEAGLVKFPLNIKVLIHEHREISGIKIFGSQYTPVYGKWSFMVDRNKLHRYWSIIGEDTDILITHGPPRGILDRNSQDEFTGCAALLKQVNRVLPSYHIFGHIHEECGKTLGFANSPTLFMNASVTGVAYIIDNNGFVFDI